MNYRDSMDHSHPMDSLMTFVLGAAAGAALALMFAPSSGRDMRARLAERGRRAAEKGREFVDEQGEVVADAVDRGRETVTSFAERVGQAVEQGKAGYRDSLRRGREAAGDDERATATAGE